MADLSGKQVDHYHLIRRLGTGAFGEVYLGEDIYEPGQVAIKVLKIEPTQATLIEFLREARTLFRLKHPNIIPLLDFGIDGEMPFLVMAYAPNGTLRQRHPSGTSLPLETVIAYARPASPGRP
ncbi:MAG: protein kinase [Chloroflexota bacterium]|nr:protein kinase [Chloroflexota bacterium]